MVPVSQEAIFASHRPSDIFSIRSDIVIEMNENFKHHPYRFKKTQTFLHVFGLLYVSARQVKQKLNQSLRYFHTLDSEELHRKLHHIKSKIQSNFTFDISWLEDLREVKIHETTGDKITPLVVESGRILITNSRIYFQPFNNINTSPVIKYNLSEFNRIVKRRYLLRQTGLELFTISNNTVLFVFSRYLKLYYFEVQVVFNLFCCIA